ncbi:hypothetical protein ZEAMMB73_Zm00001d052264 [Zea mays]|uniref:Uncharacterized protein n=1 Tax=Zea mays TaxID=4577 RepID=A0A1Q0YWK9_MAIZE|nr:hypothetical protein ZEAMMB73_Zm00001d052264 [Zea mays]
MPAQQRAPVRRRRLVQPAARPLRHVAARVPAHRALQGWHCPRLLPQGRVQQEGRHPVHHQRPLLLQPGAGDQRGRRRRRARGGREGRPFRGVAGPVAQLGPELAEQHAPGRAGPLLPRHHQRRPLRGLQQRCPARLGLRPDLQRGPVQLNTLHRSRSVVSSVVDAVPQVSRPPSLGACREAPWFYEWCISLWIWGITSSLGLVLARVLSCWC